MAKGFDKWVDPFFNEEEINKDMEKAKSSRDYFKFPEGITNIRILPGVESKAYTEHTVHYVPRTDSGTDEAKSIPILCPKFYKGEDCPICEYVQRLRDSGTEKGKNLANQLSAKFRYLFQIVVRGKEDKGVQKVSVTKEFYSNVLSIMSDPDYGCIYHPTKGRDVKVNRTGTGPRDTKYALTPRPTPTNLHEDNDQMAAWMDQRQKWVDMLVVPSRKEILNSVPELKALEAGDDPPMKQLNKPPKKEDDDDDIPFSKPKTQKPAKKRSWEESIGEDDSEEELDA